LRGIMADVKTSEECGELMNKRVVVPDIVNPPAKLAALMGRVLTINDIDSLPTEADFRDESVRGLVDASISANKNIIFTSVKMRIERWEWKFRFLWHGRGLDGRVMLLIVDDIFPTMFIRRPDGLPVDVFMDEIKKDLVMLRANELAQSITMTKKKRLVYFEESPHDHARVQFTSLKAFDTAIKHFKIERKWVVGDTDFPKSRFYLQAIRAENINPAAMNTFRFKQHGNPYRNHIALEDAEVFVVSVKDICPYEPEAGETREAYVIPRSIMGNFDIETGSAERGQALDASRDDTHSHVISYTQRYNKKDLFRVSLTTSKYVRPSAGFVQIVCDSEPHMFLAFANIIKRLRPAKISHYNGDDFDWRFIVTKLIKYALVEPFFATIDFLKADFSWVSRTGVQRAEYIASQYMTNGFVKISAEEPRCPIYYPDLISFLNIDIFTMCKRKWPAGKYSARSLNAFLEKVGEPPKFDMPAWRQFDIYEDELLITERAPKQLMERKAEEYKSRLPADYKEAYAHALTQAIDPDAHTKNITDVNVYCVFDTISALDLCDKAGIETELVIVGSQYKCTQHEAIYLAKGGLVMDKVVTSGFAAGYLDCDEPPGQLCSYPGALVLHPPRRGLTNVVMSARDRARSRPEWKSVTEAELKIMEAAFLSNYDAPLEEKDVDQLSPVALNLFRALVEIKKDVPDVDWDFASMYPTIMAEHNSSTERIVPPSEEKALLAKGYDLYTVERLINGQKIRTCFVKAPRERPVKPEEEVKLRAEGRESELIRRAVQPADGIMGDESGQALFIRECPGPEKRGLIPAEQHWLKLKRAEKNKQLKIEKAKLEGMSREANEYAYNVQSAIVDRLNAEQLECKVAMNTMYGKMGDQSNKFFRLEVSSDVTLSGREYLLRVIKILLEATLYNWDSAWDEIMYGDTDSVYAKPPTHLFKDIHRLYYGGVISRAEYASRLVERAIELAKKMEKTINSVLRAEGSDFMTMASEGAHFPAMFIRQKRNCTGEHKDKAHFDDQGNPADYHKTGVADKKGKSSSKLFSTLSTAMISRLININNTQTAREIAEDIIRDAYRKADRGEWPLEMFIRRAQYKPEKKNVAVINFFERLKSEGRTPPRPYEKFEYVFVRCDHMEYDYKGNKGKVGNGEYMELFSYAQANNLPINFSKYMLGEICAELGQYMCCDPDFVIQAAEDSDDARARAEDATSEYGKQFIVNICESAAGMLTTDVKKPVYVSIFKLVDAHMTKQYTKPAKLNKTHIKMLADFTKADGGAYDLFFEKVRAEALALAKPLSDDLKKEYIDCSIGKVARMHTQLQDPKNSPKAMYVQSIRSRKEQLLTDLHAQAKQLDAFAKWYAEVMRKKACDVRNSLGLNKAIITADDMRSAAESIRSGISVIAGVETPPMKVPSAEVFKECETIIAELVRIDRQIIAFETFHEFINMRMGEFAQHGMHITKSAVSDIAEQAASEISLDDIDFGDSSLSIAYHV
jgi:DNA polymerase elongation subunit (family B)